MLSERVKEKLFSYADRLHFLIFTSKMGVEMKKFIGNLSWSFFGGVIAAGIMLVVNVVAGRILGPEDYGKYGLIIAVASILLIPMLLGVDTSLTHYIARASSKKEKDEYVASAIWMTILSIGIATIVILLLIPDLQQFLGLDINIIKLGTLFAIFLAVRNFLDSVIKGLGLFEFQSKLRIIEAILVGLVFLFFLYLGVLSYELYILAILAGYTVVFLASLWRLRNINRMTVKYSKEIIIYGTYAILGSFFILATNNFDKILINRFIGPHELGVYTAYMTVSFLLVTQAISLFINVFFAQVSTIRDDKMVCLKLNKLAFYIGIPSFVTLFLLTFTVVSFFGESFYIDYYLVAGVSLLATLVAYTTVLWWLIASRGTEGVRFTSSNGIIAGAAFLVLMYACHEILSLYLVIFFLILAHVYLAIIGNIRYSRQAIK